MDIAILSIVFISYFLVVDYLGYITWKRTKSSEDYFATGRKTHSYFMALSYGPIFISKFAILGFCGFTGEFGLNFMGLCFNNTCWCVYCYCILWKAYS